MRVVLDTLILVRGLINPFSRCERIVFEHTDAYEMIVSPAIVAEYLSVVGRPELKRKYRSTATRHPRTILDMVARARVVEPASVPAVARDPHDHMFLAAGKTGSADYLVAEDADLLVLGHFKQLVIVTAEEFLAILSPRALD